MTLSHNYDFEIDLVSAYVSQYSTSTSDNKTTFVVVSDGSQNLTDIAMFEGSNVKVESVNIVNSLAQEVEIEGIDVQVSGFELQLAGPNPFNPTTSLNIVIPEAGFVSVDVYNIIGQKVATLVNGYMEASDSYSITWNAGNLSSGVYFARAITSNQVSTQKLMLIK